MRNSSHVLRVLVVEDGEADFRFLAGLLEKSATAEYQLDWAAGVASGRERLRRADHDIALLNFHLDGGSGVELLQEARQGERGMPVILLTGPDEESAEVDRQALQAGAADLLCKAGLTGAELERAIRYVLHQTAMHSALRQSQQQLELFMHNVPCAVCIRDDDGRLLFQNELFGEHFRNGELHRVLQLAPNVKDWHCADHGRHWLVNSFTMVSAESRRLQGFAAVNITRRIHIEEQLQRTMRVLNGILSSLPVIASSVDADGTILEFRGRGLEAIGLHDGELVGGKFCAAYPEVAAEITKAIEGGSSNFVWPVRHAGRQHYFDSYFHFDAERGRGAIGFSVNATARIETEIAHNSQTQLLHSIIRSMPVMVGRLDAMGRVVEAQGDGLVSRGLEPGRLVGKNFAQLYPQSRDAIARAQRNETANFTLTGRSEDKEWQAEFSVMADREAGHGATFFGRDMTERRWLERHILTISDAEQQRIGADLHDGLGQQLTGLACLVAALRDRLKVGNPAEAEQADLIVRLANDATTQARAMARGLCPVQLERVGLFSALEDLTCQSQWLFSVSCRFRAKGTVPYCEHMVAMHLYRITQEAIHNAVRHGGASQITVDLISVAQRHRLIVTDNGRGFDPGVQRAAPGGGLRLMNYRATVIGAAFSLRSRPGGGTRVACNFTTPFHENENDSRTSGEQAGRTAQTPDLARR